MLLVKMGMSEGDGFCWNAPYGHCATGQSAGTSNLENCLAEYYIGKSMDGFNVRANILCIVLGGICFTHVIGLYLGFKGKLKLF